MGKLPMEWVDWEGTMLKLPATLVRFLESHISSDGELRPDLVIPWEDRVFEEELKLAKKRPGIPEFKKVYGK